jgi:hypothetical protein
MPAELGFGQPIEVTVSLCGAWYPFGEAAEALERIDRALYC